MPVEVFIQPDMAPYITPQILEERMKNGDISTAQLDVVRRNLSIHLTSGTLEADIANKAFKKWVDTSVYGPQVNFDPLIFP